MANTTSRPVEADVAVFDRLHHAFGKSHISLAPHASQIMNLNDLIEQSAAAMLGSLELSFAGDPGSIVFSGGVEDDAVGYSAALRIMTMPMAAETSSTCTVAAAGLMLGKPDPMEGFPSSIRFRLFGYAHNAEIPLLRYSRLRITWIRLGLTIFPYLTSICGLAKASI